MFFFNICKQFAVRLEHSGESVKKNCICLDGWDAKSQNYKELSVWNSETPTAGFEVEDLPLLRRLLLL